MTYKHIVFGALAVVLLAVCGRNQVCAQHDTFSGVLQLATTIVAIAGGNAGVTARRRRRRKEKVASVTKDPPT